MSCRFTDPDTGATHEEIIDDLSWQLTASQKDRAELIRQVNALKEAISPGRIRNLDYYLEVAAKMRERERAIRPKGE